MNVPMKTYHCVVKEVDCYTNMLPV